MSDDFTPTTEKVRYCASTAYTWLALQTESFDRWLTAHDAEIRTAALEEAAGIADQVWASAQQHGFDGVTEAAVSEIIAERIRAAKVGAQ